MKNQEQKEYEAPQTAIICMQNIKSDTLVFIVFNFLGSFLNRRVRVIKGCRNR